MFDTRLCQYPTQARHPYYVLYFWTLQVFTCSCLCRVWYPYRCLCFIARNFVLRTRVFNHLGVQLIWSCLSVDLSIMRERLLIRQSIMHFLFLTCESRNDPWDCWSWRKHVARKGSGYVLRRWCYMILLPVRSVYKKQISNLLTSIKYQVPPKNIHFS